jgi:hypothetical protein
MSFAPDGRMIFVWRGAEDTGRLADAIADAGAAKGLCNYDGRLARVDPAGALVPMNLAAFQDFVGQNICGARVVCLDGIWQHEHYTFQFAPTPRPRNPTAATALPRDEPSREPDAAILRMLYDREVLLRIPRVVE